MPVTLEIVHPRKLTALEWAVLRVVDEFRDAPPSLHEVAYQLGIEDPSFLVDAVKEAVRLQALAPRVEDVSPRDLPDLDFTPLGFELYQRGQIEAEPAEHGETLYFDALTDEAMPAPKQLENWPETPFPSTQPAPEARESVGLDRAREIVRRLHPDLLKGDGEVRSVAPQEGDWPRVAWRPVDLELRIDADGKVAVTAKDLTRATSTFLAASDLVAEGILPVRAISETWAHEGSPRCSSKLDHAGWRGLVDRTLPISVVEPEVLRLLGQARDEVVAHSAWLALGPVRERLHALAMDGRRVLVVNGEETACFALTERPRPGIALSVQVDAPVVGAMVVDGRTGVLLDDVAVRIGDSTATIELAGVLGRDGARRCRTAMLAEVVRVLPASPQQPPSPIRLDDRGSPQAAADRALEDAELRLALGRLAARQDAAAFADVVRVGAKLAQSLDRVALFVRLSGFGRSFAPDLKPQDVLAPAQAEWRAAAALLANADDVLEAAVLLARLAPEGVEADELVAPAVAAGTASSHGGQPQEAGAFLEGLRTAVDARWGRAAASRCRSWTDARGRVLAPAVWSLATLSEAVAIATRLLDRKEQGRWAEQLITALPEPAGVQDWRAWVDGMVHLREVAPKAVDQATHRAWVELVEAWPEERKTLVGLAQGVVPDQEVAAHLLRRADSLGEVDRVRRLLLEAGYSDDPAWWRRQFESMLPDPAAVHATSTTTELVRELGRLGRDGPATAGLGQAWAARIADQIPAPTTPEGIPWWLNELVSLRPLLSGLEQRAARGVRPFRGQLSVAKAKGDPLWSDCLRAWRELGIPEAALVDLVDTKSTSGSDTTNSPPKGGKKGKKRRRR